MSQLPTSTVTQWGWSTLSLWKRCETAYWNSHLRTHPKAPPDRPGLELKQVSVALVVGSATHRALEQWYLSDWQGDRDGGGRNLDLAIKSGVEYLHNQAGRIYGGSEGVEKAEVVVRGLVQGYHTKYANDTLRVVAGPGGEPLVEQEFHLDLGANHTYTARLDTVVTDPIEDPEGVTSLEHKTTSINNQRSLVEGLWVDGQVSGEQVQMEAFWDPSRVRGVLANLLVKPEARRAPTEPYQRHLYHRPQWQLEKFTLDARRRLGQIEEATATYRLLLSGGMTEDEAARVAFDASQAGMKTCQGCDFLKLCKDRASPQREWIAEMHYQPKEPR